MRCPRCGLEINPLSERCTNCGTSAKLAKPDGDTMTRVRRQIAVVRRETETPDENYTDASFSPVMKFEKEPDAGFVEENPAENFTDQIFQPVDIAALMRRKEESEADARHRVIAAEIRSMVKHKEDDLLAEYYFQDGISDLEKHELAKRHDTQARREALPEEEAKASPEKDAEEPMSEAARRLNTFPEESGLDKILTFFFETTDRLWLNIKGSFQRTVLAAVRRLYHRLDQKTAPVMDRLLDRFYALRFGHLVRKRAESEAERRRARRTVWSVCAVLTVVLLCVGIFVTTLFTDSITGKWVVSYDAANKPNVIMEFKPGGGAVVSVKSDDGWHIHKQGRYKTQRKNGHDLLTITYEDGSVSRLYYVIEGRSGTFINVETNVEVVYNLK